VLDPAPHREESFRRGVGLDLQLVVQQQVADRGDRDGVAVGAGAGEAEALPVGRGREGWRRGGRSRRWGEGRGRRRDAGGWRGGGGGRRRAAVNGERRRRRTG